MERKARSITLKHRSDQARESERQGSKGRARARGSFESVRSRNRDGSAMAPGMGTKRSEARRDRRRRLKRNGGDRNGPERCRRVWAQASDRFEDRAEGPDDRPRPRPSRPCSNPASPAESVPDADTSTSA